MDIEIESVLVDGNYNKHALVLEEDDVHMVVEMKMEVEGSLFFGIEVNSWKREIYEDFLDERVGVDLLSWP